MANPKIHISYDSDPNSKGIIFDMDLGDKYHSFEKELANFINNLTDEAADSWDRVSKDMMDNEKALNYARCAMRLMTFNLVLGQCVEHIQPMVKATDGILSEMFKDESFLVYLNSFKKEQEENGGVK